LLENSVETSFDYDTDTRYLHVASVSHCTLTGFWREDVLISEHFKEARKESGVFV
jgi:hypothetical protein